LSVGHVRRWATPTLNDVARIYDVVGKQSHWPPLTETANFKKITDTY